MRLEITHTIKAINYHAFLGAYKEALTLDRESNPSHKEPRFLVSLFGEINRVRIEFEIEQSDTVFQTWVDNGYPSMIEGEQDSHHSKFLELSDKTEVAWLRDVDVSAA
tara:strand:- start:262 stop:585 length:324 start_codon:yes stop_codon:yes gene_type:complete